MRTVRMNNSIGTGLDSIKWSNTSGTESNIASFTVLDGFDFTDDTINIGDTIDLTRNSESVQGILVSVAKIISNDTKIYVKTAPLENTKLGIGTYTVSCGSKEIGTVEYNSAYSNFTTSQLLPPNDEIWYTTEAGGAIGVITSDMGQDTTYIGPNVLSNTAPNDNNGKGIIKFSEAITKLGFIGDTLEEFATQYYPIIGPADMDNFLTGFTLPACLTYLGYEAIPYCTKIEELTIPDTVTDMWTISNYDGGLGTVACPFLSSRTYENGVTPTGGLEKIITSKGEYTWQEHETNHVYDHMNITLGNGQEFTLVDIIVL